MKKLFGRRRKQQVVQPGRRLSQDADANESSADENEHQFAPSTTYRRNRTITGSSSASVASSNELRAELRSPRAHTHHLARARRKIFGHFTVVIFAALGVYLLLSQAIASVGVSAGAAQLTPERRTQYEAMVDEYFNKYPLQRLHFNVDTRQLANYAASKYPEIESIHVDTSGIFGRAQATLRLRTPIARWSMQERNEFVDHQGVVFSYNGYAAPSLQIVDTTGTTTASGIVTSDRFLAFVGRVVGAAKAQGYQVTEAIIPPLTTHQLEIKVSSVPYRIKYTIDRTAGEQAEDMARTIRYLQGKGVAAEYIDVRVQGRVAYK